MLLAASGYAPGDITIHMFTIAIDSEAAQLMQAQLKEGGINLEVDITETMVGFTKMNTGDYEMYNGESMLDPNRNLWSLDGRLPPSSTLGGSLYQDEEFYKLLDAAYYELDDAKRIEAYGAIQDYVIEHCIEIGLTTTVAIIARSSGVTGVNLSSVGYLDPTFMRPVA